MTIREKFNTVSEKNTDWSSMTCFTETIRDSGITRANINSWLNKLVDKDDYESSQKGEILDFLETVTNNNRND